MKKLLTLLLMGLLGVSVCGQSYEWIVDNTGDDPGERVVARFKTTDMTYPYNGLGVVGQAIDNNGNWGYKLPSVADFRLFINFNDATYDMIQSAKTYNVILSLKKISSQEYVLVAKCNTDHSAMRVLFTKVEGNASVTMGNPNVVFTEGNELMAEPRYVNSFNYGNVGIGTTTPDHKLDVCGTVRAKEVKVEEFTCSNGSFNGTLTANNITFAANGNTADFVFSDNYDLIDLSEVESFIKTNKHLPDIPSACEMEEKGVNLSDMNALLLQKVEELTLYTINQNKKSEQQNKTIEELKKMIELQNEQLRRLESTMNQ